MKPFYFCNRNRRRATTSLWGGLGLSHTFPHPKFLAGFCCRGMEDGFASGAGSEQGYSPLKMLSLPQSRMENLGRISWTWIVALPDPLGECGRRQDPSLPLCMERKAGRKASKKSLLALMLFRRQCPVSGVSVTMTERVIKMIMVT